MTERRRPNAGSPLVGKIIAVALLVFLILIITACASGVPPKGETRFSDDWFTEYDTGADKTLRCNVDNENSHSYNKTCYVLNP